MMFDATLTRRQDMPRRSMMNGAHFGQFFLELLAFQPCELRETHD